MSDNTPHDSAAMPPASDGPVRPGYILGDHWLEVAYERICAGDREETVMDDYGWVRLTDAERKAIRFAAGEAAAIAEQNPTSKFWADHAVCLRSAAERLG